MLAARAVNKPHPLALSGITTQINGVEDAYLIEGGRVAKYVVKDPKQLGTFYGQGVVINKEGAIQTYKKLLENSGG